VTSAHVQPRLQLLRTSYTVRGDINMPNAIKTEKVVATIRELEKRLRLSQPYTWMLYIIICYFKILKS